MKNITIIIYFIFSGFNLAANPTPCEGQVSWDESYLIFDYGNGEVGEMKIVDYYIDSVTDLFIITAENQDGSIVEVSVKDYLLSYIISIEHKNEDGDICTGTRLISKN